MKYLRVRKKDIGNLSKRNVLECIREYQPINRAAIAKKVGLSIPAVMTITEELLECRMIESAGRMDVGVGKHPELYCICGKYYRYIGVDVGRLTVRVVLTDQNGEVLGSLQQPTGDVKDARQCVERICSQIRQVVETSDVERSTIVGICVAMPGLIEEDTGSVIFSPDFGWKDVPLKIWVEECIPEFQTIVVNANRAQAKWEVRPGRNNQDATIFCVGLGYGIGSAIISQGEMYNGSSGTSGEIGHIPVASEGPLCLCGNKGCLEAVASGYAIAEHAKLLVLSGEATVIREMCGADTEKIDAKMVFEAAAMQDEAARKIVDRAADYVGIALATAINMLDPDIIYLCGGLLRSGEYFLKRIKEFTRQRQMHLAGRHVVITAGSADPLNVACGATLMLQDHGYEFDALKFLY